MLRLVIDGLVVRHETHPAESLLDHAPVVFALLSFTIITSWLVISTAIGGLVSLIGTPIVILIVLLTPTWLRSSFTMEGNHRIIVDDRGFQIGSVLVPWDRITLSRHGDHETATSLWHVGDETIIVSFDHDDSRFLAFLGLKLHPLHPFLKTEELSTTLSHEELLMLETILHTYGTFS